MIGRTVGSTEILVSLGATTRFIGPLAVGRSFRNKTKGLTMFHLGKRSKQRLEGLHPDLRSVVELAITLAMVDFTVLEGVRPEKRQLLLFAAGATSTMNSRHMVKQKKDGGTGLAYAVDLGAWVGGEVRWDWPLYDKIATCMKLAAVELDIEIVWGGDWRSFKDGPHFQLPWATYPA